MEESSRILFCWAALLAGILSPTAALAQQDAPPAPVRIASAENRQIAPRMWVAGTVISRDDAQISAEVDGRLTSVAEVGEFIEKDQAVAVIDDNRLQLQHKEASSNVKSLDTRIGFLKKEVTRTDKLARSKLTSETAVDQARSDYEIAVADRDAAQARLALIDDRLGKTRIAAPFSGYVTERFKMPGENVGEGTPVVRLVGLDNLEIEASAPLRYVRYIRKGMEIRVKNYEQQARATVHSLVSIGANESRQFIMRLNIDMKAWPPGMPIRAAIPTEELGEHLVVPRDALVIRRDGTYVYRIAGNNTVDRVNVTTGIADGDVIAVSGDLKAGDRVVTRGGERLRPGQNVKILNDK